LELLTHLEYVVSQEIPPSPEVATFTVFFMAFTAMIGKELLQLDYETDTPGKTILSTYVHTSGTLALSETVVTDEDSSKTSEEEKEGMTEMRTARPKFASLLDENKRQRSAGSDSRDLSSQEENSESLKQSSSKSEIRPTAVPGNVSSEPRRRFTDSLSSLQIEEAKATGRAQLGLAFEMLTMMKKRALRADPEAYQCLIDACGRVGDTQRATDLLAKMHEDGIVADGTVYACLVSAFSAESAWRKGTKEEDLPGKIRPGTFALLIQL
jgi:pentatricopeptide repeat protein